jgi:hypothetical protein
LDAIGPGRSELDVDDNCAIKARELRTLAAQFRAKAEETQLLKYIELMQRSAEELDRLAAELEMRPDGRQASARANRA